MVKDRTSATRKPCGDVPAGLGTIAQIVIDGRTVTTDGGALNAAIIVTLAGLSPATVVVRLVDDRAEHFDPHLAVVIRQGVTAQFRCFADGGLYQLKVAGASWDWGAPEIGAGDIRSIAGVKTDQRLFHAGCPDFIADDESIDLAVRAIPNLVFAPCPTTQRHHGDFNTVDWLEANRQILKQSSGGPRHVAARSAA